MVDIVNAIELCRIVEGFAPDYGCHVALTGGCLYKNGDRKDVDILFYRIRQVEKIDHDGLIKALESAGFYEIEGFGWILKGKYKGIDVDMFFPEEIGDSEYPRADKDDLPMKDIFK